MCGVIGAQPLTGGEQAPASSREAADGLHTEQNAAISRINAKNPKILAGAMAKVGWRKDSQKMLNSKMVVTDGWTQL